MLYFLKLRPKLRPKFFNTAPSHCYEYQKIFHTDDPGENRNMRQMCELISHNHNFVNHDYLIKSCLKIILDAGTINGGILWNLYNCWPSSAKKASWTVPIFQMAESGLEKKLLHCKRTLLWAKTSKISWEQTTRTQKVCNLIIKLSNVRSLKWLLGRI